MSSVLVITTGGTIAGQVAIKNEQSLSRDDLQVQRSEMFNDAIQRALEPSKKYLEDIYGINIDILIQPFSNIDSSDISPENWSGLADLIKTEYDKYDSFIITHGTNTLGYTCAALSFALVNPNKPIILTGSQVPAGYPGSDGLTNFENALRVAVWQRESGLAPIKGVLAVFGSHIITGTRVKKDTEFDYDAFKSFNTASIGRIGRIININENNLAKHNSYLKTSEFREARRQDELICENDYNMNIVSLTEFPGMSDDIFESLIRPPVSVQGIIFRAFGAGDPATKHHEIFKKLRERQIPIVVTTQAPNGNANFQVNESGQFLKKNNLAIPAYDMSIESQTTKLSWLLAKKEKGLLTYEQLCKEMIRDIRGEINVMWEIGV